MSILLPKIKIPAPVSPDDPARANVETLDSGLLVLKFLDMATAIHQIQENTQLQEDRNDIKTAITLEEREVRRRSENFIRFPRVRTNSIWEVDRISVKAPAFGATSSIAVFAGNPGQAENYISSNVFTSGEYGRVELSQPAIIHPGVELSVDVFNNSESTAFITVVAWYRLITQDPSTLNPS